MSEVLATRERINLATQVGESHFREFKSALAGPAGSKTARAAREICVDIARTLVAFANADGGELLVGVEDDGSVSGIPHGEEDLALMQDAIRTHVHPDTPLPSPMQALVEFEGVRVFYLRVRKGTDHIHLTSDGRCIRRDDRDSVPVSVETISVRRLEGVSRGWEREFAPRATLDDLNLDLVESVAAQIAYGISAEKCLQYLDLAEFSAEGLLLRNASLVLFAKDVRSWHPRCQVRLMQVEGRERLTGPDYNVDRDEVVAGNLLELVDSAWERLTLALGGPTRLTESVKFETKHMFPQLACREALINAIVHRNYAIEGRGIEVTVFSDRLEITSPGELLSTVSIGDLASGTGVHESRNPLIARVLREVGFVREMGEGVVRILEVMRSNSMTEPEFLSHRGTFTVALHNRSMYSESVRLWLSNFDHFSLTDAQRAVIALGYEGNEFSTQDVIDRLGIVDTDEIREVTTPIRSLGILVRTKDGAAMYRYAKERRVPKRAVPSYKVVTLSSGQEAQAQEPIFSAIESEQEELVLYVGNLSYGVDQSQLIDFLSQFANVLAVDFPGHKEAHQQNRGFGFVTVAHEADAQPLVQQLDGQELRGRRIRVQLPRRSV